jgi:C1A family cysteine protease
MVGGRTQYFGWQPDLGDHRDFLVEQQHVRALLRRLKMRTRGANKLPEMVDWREFCGPIADQGNLPISTANAVVALVQQFERRATGRLLRPSSLFAHWTAGRLENNLASPARSLRSVFKAIVRCGIPPEQHWPNDGHGLDSEPDSLAFSFQREYRNLRYIRLGGGEATGQQVVDQLRSFLAAGFTIACGFPVCTTLSGDAPIPFPTAADSIVGGQAVCAVGYNDKLRIRSDRGALLVRASWGVGWGDKGFGWLPYSYVKSRLATDVWTIVKPAWLRSGEFEMPR